MAQGIYRISLLLAVALLTAQTSGAAGCGLRWQALAPDVWHLPAARGRPDAANGGVTTQLVLVRDAAARRLWLIGSGPTPAFARKLACAARRAAGLAVTDVVNTHVAPELSLGNSVFLPAARLWALPEVIAAMQERCGACLIGLRDQIGARAGASLGAPERVIRVPQHAVRSGDRLGPFELALALDRQPGEPALALRRGGLVIAQGLLWTGAVPDLQGTRSATLLDSLDRLEGLAAGALLVGEQGPPAGVDAAIAPQRRYLLALRAAVRERLAAGAVQSELPLPEFAAWPGYATLHPLNVQRVWRELEAELFDQ